MISSRSLRTVEAVASLRGPCRHRAATSPGLTSGVTGARPTGPSSRRSSRRTRGRAAELLGSHVRNRLGHGHRIRWPGQGIPGGDYPPPPTPPPPPPLPPLLPPRSARPRGLRPGRSRRGEGGARVDEPRQRPAVGSTQRGTALGRGVDPEDRQIMECPRCDSNAHCAGFESAPSADWGTGACRSARRLPAAA